MTALNKASSCEPERGITIQTAEATPKQLLAVLEERFEANRLEGPYVITGDLYNEKLPTLSVADTSKNINEGHRRHPLYNGYKNRR